MSVPFAHPLEQLIKRERLFVWLRFGALLLLLGLVALDPLSHAPLSLVVYVVAAGLLWNGLSWWLLRERRWVNWLTVLISVIDALLLLFFLMITGAAQSALWSFVYVLIAATALRYGILGAIFTAALFGIVHLAYGVVDFGTAPDSLYQSAVRALSFMVIAVLVGWVVRHERTETRSEAEQAHQALQRSQFDVEAFKELSGTISSNTNYQVALEQMLDLSLRGLRVRGHSEITAAGMILLFESAGEETLYVAAQRNLMPPDDTRHLRPIAGHIHTVLEKVDPLIVENAQHDPLLGQFELVKKYPAAAILPLRARFTLYGVIIYVGPEMLLESFQNRIDFLESYAAQAAIAVQNAQLYAQLRAEHDRIVDSEEKARHELARDLHDGPINAVASLTMGLDFTKRLIDEEPSKAREELNNLHKLAAKTARDMRTTMYRLRPLALETSGLNAALEQYLHRLQAEQDQPKFHLTLPNAKEYESRLSSNSATMVFDIVKEAVGNALKHAEAKNVWVYVRVSDSSLVTSILDDGKGFDLAAVEENYAARGSLGMINIHERAELAHGDATIESQPGQGTTVTVRVPLTR